MADHREFQLTTARLLLRPLRPADAPALQRLLTNWNVVKMTARIPHPYPEGAGQQWIAAQAEAWRTGSAYVFALVKDGALVGSVGLDHRGDESYELGYWVGEPWWGQGFASEAAVEIVRFAFEELGANQLKSGHFTSNPASGRVLAKCGFRDDGTETLWCEARGQELSSRRLILRRNEMDAQGQAS